MNLEEKVWSTCEQYQMVQSGNSVLVGLSGGADSVCLLWLLDRLGKKHDFKVRALHIHHGIRGAEADRDCDFAKRLCEEWGIPFEKVLEDVPSYAVSHKMSQEEAGRVLRYRNLRSKAKEYGCEKIAVAHHGDDQIETVLMNLFRGSAGLGLCGMAPVSGNMIRPLLFCTKEEILQEMEKNNISFCNDSTNENNIYMRNRVRNQLMPWIQEHINEKAGQHILQMAWQQRQIQDYLQGEIQKVYEQVSRKTKEQGLELNKKKLLQLPEVIRSGVVRKALQEVGGGLKDVSMVHTMQALSLLEARTGSKLDFPYQVQGKTGYEYVRFYQKKTQSTQTVESKWDRLVWSLEPEEVCKEIEIPQKDAIFRYRLIKKQEKNVKIPENLYTKWLNCDNIKNTLQIRTRRSGDVIAVCKSGGHKKLKDFFIDCKIPAEKRDDILLLADGSEIVWVIGYRLSEAYKVDDKQKRILQVEFCSSLQIQT